MEVLACARALGAYADAYTITYQVFGNISVMVQKKDNKKLFGQYFGRFQRESARKHLAFLALTPPE